jgi:hypothetical protein
MAEAGEYRKTIAASPCRPGSGEAAGRLSGCPAVLLIILLMSWAAPLNGQPVAPVTEQSIKAAYLYKFAAYVEWPDGAFATESGPLVIGVHGADFLADELRKMTVERTIGGRPIAVRSVQPFDPLDDVHILFVSAASARSLSPLAEAARTHSVLMVTESGDALERGSVINFHPVDQRIRFDVSLESADRNRLKLSARLLAVADHVLPRQR